MLQEKAELQARINLIPYDGSPEIKENASGKYLYIRKRIGSRLTSTYVDVYSDDLYQLLLRNARELRELKKSARANMKSNIYDQAVLEGVAFKKKLIAYYEGKDIDDISSFLKEKCWKNF